MMHITTLNDRFKVGLIT